MIWVDRSTVAEPPSLATAGLTECAKATAFYKRASNRLLGFSFKAYGSPDVRDALNALFHGKCAYCESRYAATAPVDVEHYRPKGAIMINGRTEKPGYYWLAASWDNLLPSCIDCNRERKQILEGDEEAGETQLAGKKNWFPLSDEALRGRTPGSEHGEEKARLLLDPCRDRPEKHLEFLPNGLVRARPRSSKGVASIEVYALLRKGLNENRRGRLLRLAQTMESILARIEELDENPASERLRRRIKLELERLQRETDASEEYAGLARQFVEAFHASLSDRTCRRFVHDFMDAVSTTPITP
jgi:uncharacterized protein (TIGR02646 family)